MLNAIKNPRCCLWTQIFASFVHEIKLFEKRGLTGVDEELVGHSRVVHVVNGRGENGSQDLQISEHCLHFEQREEEKKKKRVQSH